MELDPNKKVLRYYVTGKGGTTTKKLKCTFDNINFDNKTYRMVLSQKCRDTITHLVEFEKGSRE